MLAVNKITGMGFFDVTEAAAAEPAAAKEIMITRKPGADFIVDAAARGRMATSPAIREARAIYDSIFPPTDAVGERPDDGDRRGDPTGLKKPAPPKGSVRMTGRP